MVKQSINFIGYYSLLVVFDGVNEVEVDGKGGGCGSCIGSCPLCCSQRDECVDELEVVVEGDDVGVWLFCLALSTASFLTW